MFFTCLTNKSFVISYISHYAKLENSCSDILFFKHIVFFFTFTKTHSPIKFSNQWYAPIESSVYRICFMSRSKDKLCKIMCYISYIIPCTYHCEYTKTGKRISCFTVIDRKHKKIMWW